MRSGVVVIVVRDALTDQRRCGACICRGPSRTSVHHVRCYVHLRHGRSMQVVLQLLRVPPSVYVFVRTCVRVRAAADAAVGLSKSCFHVPLCSTLLLLSHCRASTYSSSAPSAFFSATSHRWASDGSVGPSSLIVGTFALFSGD